MSRSRAAIRRAKCVIWNLYPNGAYPQGMVSFEDDGKTLVITYVEQEDRFCDQVIKLNRRQARMLAKRINRALDATQ